MRQEFSRALLLSLTLSLLAGPLVAAPDNEAPTPKSPLLPRAPQMAAWTITYTYAPPPAAKAGDDAPAAAHVYVPERPTQLQVTKSGTTYHLSTTYSTGRVGESWIIDGREVTKMPTGSLYLHCTSGDRYDDYTKSDFDELSWLSESSYVGLKKKGDRQVFVFSIDNKTRPLGRREKIMFDLGTAVSLPPGSTPAQQAALLKKGAEAYKESAYGKTTSTVQLDAATQLPVEWNDGKVDRVYKFTDAPTDNLVPPPEVAAEFKSWAQQVPH